MDVAEARLDGVNTHGHIALHVSSKVGTSKIECLSEPREANGNPLFNEINDTNTMYQNR